MLRAEVLYTLSLTGVAVLALLAHFNAYFGWDLRASRAPQSLSVPGLFTAMRFLSLFGDDWIPYALTTLTAIIFLIFRRRSEAAGIIFSAGGSSIVTRLMKIMVARPRPSQELV